MDYYDWFQVVCFLFSPYVRGSSVCATSLGGLKWPFESKKQEDTRASRSSSLETHRAACTTQLSCRVLKISFCCKNVSIWCPMLWKRHKKEIRVNGKIERTSSLLGVWVSISLYSFVSSLNNSYLNLRSTLITFYFLNVTNWMSDLNVVLLRVSN